MSSSNKNTYMPSTVVLLLSLIALVGLAALFIPSGRYDTIVENGRTIIDPATFHNVPKPHLSFVDFFSVIHQGLTAAGPLIFMILIIGGAIRVFESTGAITGVVAEFARRFGWDQASWVLALIMAFFAFLGAFPGMLEAAIPFAPLCLSIALALGYDVIVGIAVPVMGIAVGWTAGPTNPWTVGIGQNMAGLPLFSGMGYRMVVLVVLWAVSMAYVLRYAARVRRDPSCSLVAGVEGVLTESHVDLDSFPFTTTHKFVLLVFFATLGLIVYGSVFWKWGFAQMSALYVIGAAVAGGVARFSPNRIAELFTEGGRAMYGGVLAVGLARGISVMMEKTDVINTIIHGLSAPLAHFSTAATASLMFVAQTIINFFIPSGSGQAMATLPIMLPLASVLKLSDQVAILAFQFGDGLSNLCYPTVAVLVAYLTFAGVPFSKWLRFIMPYMVVVWIVSIVFTAGGVMIGWR